MTTRLIACIVGLWTMLAAPVAAQPEMSEPDVTPRVRIPPIVIPQDKPAVDRRPIYVGAGLVVLAAVFWWNRRQRERFDRDSERPNDDDR
jgi:hypothetical protein